MLTELKYSQGNLLVHNVNKKAYATMKLQFEMKRNIQKHNVEVKGISVTSSNSSEGFNNLKIQTLKKGIT